MLQRNDCIKSSAAAVVEMAAYRIDVEPYIVRLVQARLHKEAITEEWQLRYIDSRNFEAMGAPKKLVASILSCLDERLSYDASTTTCRTSLCSSSAFDEFFEASEVADDTALDEDGANSATYGEPPQEAKRRHQNRRAPLPPRRLASLNDGSSHH